jgi:hypothetical protein
MCSPAPVLHEPERPSLPPAAPLAQPVLPASQSNTLRSKLQSWLAGWKQTVIAELASLGSPKEGFL